RQNHAWCADPALRPHFAHEQRLQRVVAAEPFDGEHFRVAHLGDGHKTGTDRGAIHEHGAGAAFALATAFLGSGEAAVFAQHVEQPRHGMRVDFGGGAVEGELHAGWVAASSSGVAGISRRSKPIWRRALTIAGAGPSIGSSPRPLAPNGPPGYGLLS